MLNLIVVPLYTFDFISEAFEDVDILLRSLDHLHPLFSHLHDGAVHVQVFLLQLQIKIVQVPLPAAQVFICQLVDRNEGACPAHPRAAVHQDGVDEASVEVPGSAV